MRVALVTDGIWPYVLGGMQKHSYYLCKYLAKAGIDVDLYHFNQSSYDISKLEFFTEQERSHIKPVVLKFPGSIPFPGHYLYNSYRYSQRVCRLIAPNLDAYDFIYTKGFSGWELIMKKRRGMIRCAPIGVKFHGYEMFQKPPGWKALIQQRLFLRWPVRSLSRNADVVFSYGGKITKIIRKLGIDEKKIMELPSGVEQITLVTHARPTPDLTRFLFLGRYERRKGVEELNKAILHNCYNGKAEFHFIGPIPGDKQVQADNVIYHGEIRDRNKLHALIESCDVLLCPSWSEGMPNVILEAMSKGLAVVATDVGANSVLVDETTGWLIPEPSPEIIAQTLSAIIGSERAPIDKKKKAALARISEHFTWERLSKKLIDYLSSVK